MKCVLKSGLGITHTTHPPKMCPSQILYKKTVFAVVYRPNQQPDFGQIHTNFVF